MQRSGKTAAMNLLYLAALGLLEQSSRRSTTGDAEFEGLTVWTPAVRSPPPRTDAPYEDSVVATNRAPVRARPALRPGPEPKKRTKFRRFR